MTSSSEWQSSLPELLRRCVGCGLCLPHCATWAVTGNEVHSPRGRLMLLGDLLDDPSSATRAAYADAFDGCLGCRACESACPGGVPFELLEHGQNLTAGMGVQPSRWVFTLIRHLDSLLVLNFLRRVGKVSRQILKAIWGQHWRRRLNGAGWKLGTLVRLLGSLPAGPSSDQDLVEQLDQLCGTKSNGEFVLPQLQPIQQDCVFFEGCANEGLLPETSRRFKELLKAMGCTVHTLASQQCCGAIADHNNQPGKASRQKRINLKVLTEESCSDFPVVTEAAGCSAHLGQYNQDMQNRTQNAVVFLHELMNTESGNKLFSNLRPIPLKVVYHDPCHAQHGQGIYEQPRQLLKKIPGLKLVDPYESQICCGSAGVWSLTHGELSQELGSRKSKNLLHTGASLVVTANPGCQGQISDALNLSSRPIPVISLTDLLWYAFLQKKGLPEGSP